MTMTEPKTRPERIPERGDDGLYRLDCPSCKRLLLRYDPKMVGRQEIQCWRSDCKNRAMVYFGAEHQPRWDT